MPEAEDGAAKGAVHAPVAYFACPPVLPAPRPKPRRAARRPPDLGARRRSRSARPVRSSARASSRACGTAARRPLPDGDRRRPRRDRGGRRARPSRSRSAGYRGGSTRENALLNLLGSFTLTFGIARALDATSSAAAARSGRSATTALGDRHIHHFVPGIVARVPRRRRRRSSRATRQLDPWLALPFGAGVALTLDESALLLELDDVYWTERGVVSLQITLGALALLSSVALALRVLRRGEAEVLGGRRGARRHGRRPT